MQVSLLEGKVPVRVNDLTYSIIVLAKQEFYFDMFFKTSLSIHSKSA